MKDNVSRTIAIWIMILAVITIAVLLYFINKPTNKVISGKADFELDAKTLFAEFDKNESEANKKYLNKVIAVHGTVTDISEPDSMGVTVSLQTDDIFHVTCELPDADAINNLAIGENVTIRGLCAGMLMDVVIVKGKIQE